MRIRVSLLTALVGAGLLLAAGARAQITERVSVASDGTEGNMGSSDPSISADGRFVAFESLADNLVSGDTNGLPDVFVHDRDTGTTELVSVASDGGPGNRESGNPAISADGRFVAFESSATNLVVGDTNGWPDIFVHDRDTGINELVSVASDGTQADWNSAESAISADGRLVAFLSFARNLVPGDNNNRQDIFVHDRDSGTTEIVNVTSDGNQANGDSHDPAISADGSVVAFRSFAGNLVPGDANLVPDIFVHDRDSGTTERVSVASDGREANESSFDPAISGDGRFVAFHTIANNLVANDTNLQRDIFVHDRDTGITERVSVASDGTQGNRDSQGAAMGADGRFVAFHSFASKLVAGDTNGQQDIFVHDRDTGVTLRVSVAGDGTQGNSESRDPAISADWRFVAFASLANNLVPGDTNGSSDIFVHDRGPPPQLSITGHCPGRVSLSLTNATPDGLVAFGWGTTERSVTLPPGPCAGAEIGLADPNPLDVLTPDLTGGISLDRNVGKGACGLLLQALDITTCEPSNVASLP